jgi:pimeloyl-ACP methyl ester carboxylesterase
MMRARKNASVAIGLTLSALLFVVAGCSSTKWPMAPAQLSVVGGGKMVLRMEQLAACQNGPEQPVILDPARPVTLIVHGCNSSGDHYRALSQFFQQQGLQALCFNYDDRDRIARSSAQLRQTLQRLITQVGATDITVIGHSQGGLVARRALVRDPQMEAVLQAHPARLRLVTVSAPFGGIGAASHCGSKALAILSLGLTIPICQLVAGSKWYEIPPGSRFISEPGELLGSVSAHLKIVTDETGACEVRSASGNCLRNDTVFTVSEQRQRVIDRSAGVLERVVKAGHVEIVGDAQRIPYKLIGILQQQGMLAAKEPPGQFPAPFNRIYGHAAN